MSSVAEQVDAVIGVDTHRDTHQVEMTAPTGAPIAITSIANTSAGYAELLGWIAEHAPGPRLAASIEGTRSYGIGVARALAATGLAVHESEQPNRKDRRGRGKSDPIDAHLAALNLLGRDVTELAVPRADGDREALRILLTARRDLTSCHTAHTNQLRALLLSGDDTDRNLARGRMPEARLAMLARRRVRAGASREHAVRQAEIRRLCLTLREEAGQLKTNKNQLRHIVDQLAPGLTRRVGVGPVTAAQTVLAYSHPGRVRDDAAFASLAGTCPVPASSGHTIRHRLNRGGDRTLNSAIYTIAITRERICPRTRAYINRRTAEGKTPREIRRCLKRYITRELYRTLTKTMTPTS